MLKWQTNGLRTDVNYFSITIVTDAERMLIQISGLEMTKDTLMWHLGKMIDIPRGNKCHQTQHMCSACFYQPFYMGVLKCVKSLDCVGDQMTSKYSFKLQC